MMLMQWFLECTAQLPGYWYKNQGNTSIDPSTRLSLPCSSYLDTRPQKSFIKGSLTQRFKLVVRVDLLASYLTHLNPVRVVSMA